MVNRCGEKSAIHCDRDAHGRGVLLAELPVCTQERHRGVVERDAALLVGLGVLLPRAGALLGNARADRQDGAVQVEQIPAHRAQLATAGSGRHGEPEQAAPHDVRERGVEDCRRLIGGRRVRVRPATARRLGLVERVDRDPAPADGAGECAAEAEVHLADRRRRQWSADVRPALLRALVRAVDGVLDERPAVAVGAAPAEDRLVVVDRLAVELRQREVPEQRADVDADRLLVAVERGLLDVEQLQVAVHELVDRGLRARVALLVDLVDEPAADLLSLRGCLRAGGHGLDQVVPLAAQGVDAGVHTDPQGPARQLLDLAAFALPGLAGGPGHGATVAGSLHV